eukprot:6203124-Pleurochrysis_carterae.AAC.1
MSVSAEEHNSRLGCGGTVLRSSDLSSQHLTSTLGSDDLRPQRVVCGCIFPMFTCERGVPSVFAHLYAHHRRLGCRRCANAAQSRVWSALRGCSRTNTSCLLPLVPPPVWRAAPRTKQARAGGGGGGGATAPALQIAQPAQITAFASALDAALLTHLLCLPVLGGIGLALLLLCWPQRHRKPRSQNSSKGVCERASTRNE